MNKQVATTVIKQFGPFTLLMVASFRMFPKKREALLYDAAIIILALLGWVYRRYLSHHVAEHVPDIYQHIFLLILGCAALFYLYGSRAGMLLSGVGIVTFVIAEWTYRRKRTG